MDSQLQSKHRITIEDEITVYARRRDPNTIKHRISVENIPSDFSL